MESAASTILNFYCWLMNFTDAGNTPGLGDYRLAETTTKPESSIVVQKPSKPVSLDFLAERNKS